MSTENTCMYMHICGREENKYPGPWETGISERAGRTQLSRRNLEGITPAQVILPWSQHSHAYRRALKALSPQLIQL